MRVAAEAVAGVVVAAVGAEVVAAEAVAALGGSGKPVFAGETTRA